MPIGLKQTTPQRSSMSKRRKVEEKSLEKNSININLEQSSDFETNVEENFQYIMSTIKRKFYGKRIPLNVVAAPLDNV